MQLTYVKQKVDTYQTIYDILKQEFKLSNRLLLKIKKAEKISLNGNFARSWFPVKVGDLVCVNLDFDEISENIVPTSIPLSILYEDEAFLILDKPAGIPVHPSILHFETSLSNGVRFYYEQCGLKRKIHPVNRLDKNTSGIVIFAKNEFIQEDCIRQMQSGSFKKEYLAICEGHLNIPVGTISAPITRKEGSIIEREINFETGSKAITHYEVLENLELESKPYSLVKCELETGRTHQIRLHFAFLNHPLLGDDLYGSASLLLPRQALHAFQIKLLHPITKEELIINSPLPYDMQSIIKVNL